MNSNRLRIITFLLSICITLSSFVGCGSYIDEMIESSLQSTESALENNSEESENKGASDTSEKYYESDFSESVSTEISESTSIETDESTEIKAPVITETKAPIVTETESTSIETDESTSIETDETPDESEKITDVMIGETIEAEYASDFSVSRVFSDDMVVQRNEHIRVWGFAPESENGKKISGEFKGMFAETLVENGEWCLTFGARLDADTVGSQMKIYTDKKEITFDGVLVGDVYMVIGQSNVEYGVSTHIQMTDPLTQGGGTDAIDPDSIIRLNRSNNSSGGTYPSKLSTEPCADFLGTLQWTKTTVSATNSFSALGYYFARALVEKNGNTVPVGIIEIGFSGAPLGAFLPNEIAEQYKTDIKDTSAGGYTTTGVNGTGNGRFIYNRYIYPFEKYAIAGMVWYQGESNNSLTEARAYNEIFVALMNHMRGTHNLINKNYPIFITEIPSIYKAPENYSGATWSYMELGIIRAYMGTLPMNLDNCYIATGSDMWADETYHNSLHPNCKFEQANRLANIAMAVVNETGNLYDATGAVLKSYTISEDKKTATVTFANVGDGIKTVDGKSPLGFVVYLEGYVDGRYVVPDKVEIVGKDTVVITHSKEFNGVAYNIGSSDYFGKTVNLCNSAGIPAAAFSTDFTEKVIENATAKDFVQIGSSGCNGKRFIDSIKLDGSTILSGSEAASASIIEITDETGNLSIKGWCGFGSEILLFGYAFDEHNAVFNTFPTDPEKAVINAAGEYAERMNVSIDVSELSYGYHTFYLLAYVDTNGGTPVILLSFIINKSEKAEETQTYYSVADAGIVKYNVDSIKADGVTIKEGSSTKNIQSLEVNNNTKKLVFAGWAGFNSEFVFVGYDIDNEGAKLTSTPTQTNESAVIAQGGSLVKRFNLSIDISDLSIGEHTVYILALVDEDNGGKLAKLMEFTLKITEQCAHSSVDENGWGAVLGEAKEQARCADCGETIVRNTTFVFCYDKITLGGCEKVGSIFTLDSTCIVDDIPNAFVTSKGLFIQGWLGLNSGTKEYKWSIDGKEWFDVDSTSTYTDSPTKVLETIEGKNQSLNLGFKDYASKVRFNISITAVKDLPAGSYDIYLGAIPNNNPGAVVPIITIKGIEVISKPDADTALKSINGIAISEYKVFVEGNHYGALYAKSLIMKEMYAISGAALATAKVANEGKTIIIRSTDTYDNGDVSGGEYHIEIDGSNIIISGSGIYGPIKAASEFIRAVSGKTDAVFESLTESIVEIDNAKNKLNNGETLQIGFIGDSVTYGHGEIDPWPTHFSNSIKEAYSGATVNILNVAKSGSTTKWGVENIQKLLLDEGYNDLIFISHGTNDKYSNLGYAETYANYVSMIEMIPASNPNCDIVFVLCGRDFEEKGIWGIKNGSISPYMSAMIDISLKYGIGIIDPMTTLYEACEEHAPGAAMTEGWKNYMQDEVHPNELGQELYGKVVFAYVETSLK